MKKWNIADENEKILGTLEYTKSKKWKIVTNGETGSWLLDKYREECGGDKLDAAHSEKWVRSRVPGEERALIEESMEQLTGSDEYDVFALLDNCAGRCERDYLHLRETG